LSEVTTSTRKEERERARAERKRKEQEEALRAQRKRRLMYLGGGLLVLIAVVAMVIAAASGGGSSPGSGGAQSSVSGVNGANAVKAQYAGIPQNGNVLGASNAPATLMVFADLQCPFCAQFETQMFPKLVNRYVRPGKLKVIFQPIAIIGQDSVAGARASASAGVQSKMFNYASLFYLNQGQENTGYITDTFLTNLAKAVPGLDVSKWKADLNSSQVDSTLSQAQSAAQTARVNSTPTFLVGKSGKPLQHFDVSEYTPQAFYPKLDSLTK
jgi:protein-disulfide isomerase